MMKNYRIIALTEKGKEAIKAIVLENMTAKGKTKTMFKLMGFTYQILDGAQTILEYNINSKIYQKLIQGDHFDKVTRENMLRLGAVWEVDYTTRWDE